MGFFDKLRNAIAGPPHVNAGGDSEVEATLHEEFGAGDAAAADLRAAESRIGGAVVPGLSAQEGAEAAEDALAPEQAPPDLDP